jgi:uncharacterized protein (TIGR03437 family)
MQVLTAAVFFGCGYAQTITPGGVVNNAGFQAPVAPGSLIAIFGTDLAAAPASASALPLPTTLGGVTVTVNGNLRLPLIYVSAKQINAQLPFETPLGTATISVNGSAPVSFTVAASAPGIITYGNNRAVAINQDGSLNSADHPAQGGGWVTVYMSGQGIVNPSIASGVASPGTPAIPALPVSATIGKKAAGVMFAGLTPGAVGLFQVNLRIPAMPSGDFALVVSVGQAHSNAPMISVSTDGQPVPSITRTIAYHQVTNIPDQGPDYRSSFAINGYGTVIAFAHDSGPNQVWLMNFDGSNARMIDSFQQQCSCGTTVDISNKGDKVVATEGRQLRYIENGAAVALLDLDSSTAGIAGLKIEADGGRIFFLVDRDGGLLGGPNELPIQRGLYMMSTDGSSLVQIVGPDAVAALFGETASNYYTPEFNDAGNGPNRTLGVTADGVHIVFAARAVGGNGPDAIFGVNVDGSALHMILGPVPYVGNVGISEDGSKVLYVITGRDFVVETGVVNFDGTGRLALRKDGLGETPGLALSADGILLLAYDILYNTDGSGALQLSAPLNDLKPGNPLMDATATHFVYPFVVPGTFSQGLAQLATMEMDPTNLGAAPAIQNPALSPDYAVAGGSAPGTVTAEVSPHDHVLAVNYSLVNAGLVEDPVNGDIFLKDDGSSGDQKAGDGVYTNNSVIAQYNAPVGPRLLRLFGEVTDSAGLRHATQVDITPFSVVSQPAPGTTARAGK